MNKIDEIRKMSNEFLEAKKKDPGIFYRVGKRIEAKAEGMGYIETKIGKHAVCDLITMEEEAREILLSKIK